MDRPLGLDLVDDAPWGFAPFHYGRWVSWNGGWGWAPGPLGYWNPYYAPALVGWIGGSGFGVGFGFGWGGGWGGRLWLVPARLGCALLSALLRMGTWRLVSRRRLGECRLLTQCQRYEHSHHQHQPHQQQLLPQQSRRHEREPQHTGRGHCGSPVSVHLGRGNQQGRHGCAQSQSGRRPVDAQHRCDADPAIRSRRSYADASCSPCFSNQPERGYAHATARRSRPL